MTVPIHSVKHVKATYHRYQVLALISAAVTIVAVLLAALFGFQLSRVSKAAQQSAHSQLSSSNQTLNNQIETLNKKIAELEQRSVKDKETIQSLEAKAADLHKRLAEAWKAAAEATAATSPTEPESQTPEQTGPVTQPQPTQQVSPPPAQTGQPVSPETKLENSVGATSPATGKTDAAAQPESVTGNKPPAEGGSNTSQ